MSGFADFTKWAKSPKLQDTILKNLKLNFLTNQSSFVCYNDADNSFMLSKGLFLDKTMQLNSMKFLYKRFIDEYKKSIEVSASGRSDIIDNYKPLLVKIPMERIKSISESHKRRIEDNLITFFSFLNNSSIWVRIIDEDDLEAEKKAGEEFAVFNEMELYNYTSAKENFDFNSRIQSENFLLGDHGHNVTPILYGDESEFYKKLFG